MNRRDFLKLGLITGAATALPFGLGAKADARRGPRRDTIDAPDFVKDHGRGRSEMPASPLILYPFTDPLPIPQALAPVRALNPAPDPGRHQIFRQPAELYHIKLQVAEHSFTSSPVIGEDGRVRSLPPSTIHGYNGTLPGPMIHARYGSPALVRFENRLDEDHGLDQGDFGVPVHQTHLHNGHTAPESDGNPNANPHPYHPGQFEDNLYLNIVPDGDTRERQSTMWYHDHVHGQTGTNVYKGRVGLYLLYDDQDTGNETQGFRLPGGKYDIPLVIHDLAFDDGVTEHDGVGQDGEPHPENWGKLFYGHYHDHGFVGDVFAVNGKIMPYLEVERRKYRFRILDASIARWWELALMRGRPRVTVNTRLRSSEAERGEWKLEDAELAMRFVQVAGEGGPLPHPLAFNSIVLAPSKRKEVVIDFSKYIDGTPTEPGDEVFLVNILEMTEGRGPEENAGFNDNLMPPGQRTAQYGAPTLKFVIGEEPAVPDQSLILPNLRPLPPLPSQSRMNQLTVREWELDRTGGNWTINGKEFDPDQQQASVPRGSEEIWKIINGGGGWVHPVHIHQEQMRILSRDGATPPPEDNSREDTIALLPGEEVVVYRRFRTFTGKYVGHCHNLAHEDFHMMWAWEIVDV